MNLREKIAQMLIIGFDGTELKDDDPIVQDIRERKIGGVILFDRDIKTLALGKKNITSPEQLKKLIKQLQDYSKNTLFIAVDYEGGDKQLKDPDSGEIKRGLGVNRLNEAYGFIPTYSAKEFAMLPQEEKGRIANEMAKMIKAMGINLVLAPVIDTATSDSIIDVKGRSFSSDPDEVIENALIQVEAYDEQNIQCCLKHYPGHGSVKPSEDTHINRANITESWKENELKPFKVLGKHVKVIMTGHLINYKLDPSGEPATFSKAMLNELRKIIGEEGIIIADDLQMKAATMHLTIKEILEKSINAGCDLLPFCNMLEYKPGIAQETIEIVLDLVKEGKVAEENIDRSYQRIMKLKANKLKLDILQQSIEPEVKYPHRASCRK